jgi:hypothetical protein
MESIDLEEAMYFLMSAERHALEDGVRWIRDGRLVAFSKDEDSLNIRIDDKAQLFTDEDSVRLRKIGIVANSKSLHKTNDFPVLAFDLAQKI